jgi:hypothetical protein
LLFGGFAVLEDGGGAVFPGNIFVIILDIEPHTLCAFGGGPVILYGPIHEIGTRAELLGSAPVGSVGVGQ